MKTLSVCMIVKNEEDVISRSIESLGNIYDELIIVDTGSSDKTINIIESLSHTNSKIKLLKFNWRYDFSAARNFSFENASSDFIMFFDSDEICQANLRNTITSLKKDDFNGFDVIDITIRHKWGDGIVHFFSNNRIVSKSINPRYKYSVHEKLTFNNTESILVVRPEDGYIIHEKKGGCDKNFKLYYNYYFLDKILNRQCDEPLYQSEFNMMSHSCLDGVQMRECIYNLFVNYNNDEDFRYSLLNSGWIDVEESLILVLISKIKNSHNSADMFYLYSLACNFINTKPFAAYHAFRFLSECEFLNSRDIALELDVNLGFLENINNDMVGSSNVELESKIKSVMNKSAVFIEKATDPILYSMPIVKLEKLFSKIIILDDSSLEANSPFNVSIRPRNPNVSVLPEKTSIVDYMIENNINSSMVINVNDEIYTHQLGEIYRDLLNKNENQSIIYL